MPAYTFSSMAAIARTLVEELGRPLGMKKYGFRDMRLKLEGGFQELAFKDNMGLKLDADAGKIEFGAIVPLSFSPSMFYDVTIIPVHESDELPRRLAIFISSDDDTDMPAFIERIREIVAQV